jgi:DNA primase
MMQLYRDGIDKPGFFQKAAPRYYPDWIETATVEKVRGTPAYAVRACRGSQISVAQ